MRQWRPRLEEINREARQFGVGVRGGVAQVALSARVHHEARNWLILSDCSNTFNTVKRTAVLTETATCVPALAPFIAKCYGERPAHTLFQMDSGERRKLTVPVECSKGMSWARRCSACHCCQYSSGSVGSSNPGVLKHLPTSMISASVCQR